jgi:hypothetical protein
MSIEYTRPWQALTGAFAHAPSFEAELQKELAPNHPLFGQPVAAIARQLGSDDVLFRVEVKPVRYAVVHLTRSGKTEPWPFSPSVEFFVSLEDFAERCMKIDSNGY